VPEIQDFYKLLIITGCGRSGKVILQVSIAVFSGTVEKFFGQRWLSPPRKNWPVCLYGARFSPIDEMGLGKMGQNH